MTVSEERLAALEARTARLEARLGLAAAPERAREPVAQPSKRRPATRARERAPKRRATAPAARAATAERQLEDVVGGRVLAWAGGVTLLVGVLFLLLVAASRGWIGEEARVLMASGASLLLLAVGFRLHERRGRTDAALAAAAAGIAGLFACAVVAGPVYGLLPAFAAMAAALAIGAAATALALRWAAPGVGWLGILGALGSPVLTGAEGGMAIALVLVAYGAAGGVLLWQRWHALAAAAFVVALPQLAGWIVDRPGGSAVLAALVLFGAVTAVGAAGFEWRARAVTVRPSAHVLLGVNALALAGLGDVALEGAALHAWLAALAAAHLAAGLLARRADRLSHELSLTVAGLGIVLADVTLASMTDGVPLVLGWAAGAVAFSALARSARLAADAGAARGAQDVSLAQSERRRADEGVALAGLGGHLLLAIATTLTSAPPIAAATGGEADVAAALAAIATVAGGAWAAARLLAPSHPELRVALDAVALAALGFWSAVALDGVALTLALAGEAVALAAVARRAGRSDPVPRIGALAFLGVAAGHALAVLAPPGALVDGLAAAGPAAAGLGAVTVAAVLIARAAGAGRERHALHGAAAVLALFLASTLLVTQFQPGGDPAALPLADLDVRQQGQALLSALWALAGVVALIAGLVRDQRAVRLGALALLGVTAGKVFLFDLAALESLYRVGSCVVLGLVLLAGAFAWQRLRPGPLPDLRGVPEALR